MNLLRSRSIVRFNCLQLKLELALSQLHAANCMDRNFEESLIEAVRNYPHLYDTSRQDYKDAKKKENSWSEIANIIDTNKEECKNKGKLIRDNFTREERKQRQSKSGDGGSSKRKLYVHYEQLQFLNGLQKRRKTVTNVTDEAHEEDSATLHSTPAGAAADSEQPAPRIEAAGISAIRSSNETKRRSKAKQLDDLVLQELSKREDKFDHFANYVASELRDMPSTDMQSQCMLEIQQCLLKCIRECQQPIVSPLDDVPLDTISASLFE